MPLNICVRLCLLQVPLGIRSLLQLSNERVEKVATSVCCVLYVCVCVFVCVCVRVCVFVCAQDIVIQSSPDMFVVGSEGKS